MNSVIFIHYIIIVDLVGNLYRPSHPMFACPHCALVIIQVNNLEFNIAEGSAMRQGVWTGLLEKAVYLHSEVNGWTRTENYLTWTDSKPFLPPCAMILPLNAASPNTPNTECHKHKNLWVLNDEKPWQSPWQTPLTWSSPLPRTLSNFNKEQNTRKPFHHVIMTQPVSSN